MIPAANERGTEGKLDGCAASAPPVFFGHYSLPAGQAPSPMTPNVACLDYGIWKGGPLVAYRWDGERVLAEEKFII